MKGNVGFFSSCMVLYFMTAKGIKCERMKATKRARPTSVNVGSVGETCEDNEADLMRSRMLSTQITK